MDYIKMPLGFGNSVFRKIFRFMAPKSVRSFVNKMRYGVIGNFFYDCTSTVMAGNANGKQF